MIDQKIDEFLQIPLVAVGETVIDMVSEEVESLQKATTFNKYVGGSPTNIAINLRSLGLRSAVISRLGEDGFGRFAYEFLRAKGVEISGIQIGEDQRTSVVLVGRSQSTPEAVHYREADKYLTFTEDARLLLDRARIVHFSGFALSGDSSRRALQEMKAYVLKKKELEKIRKKGDETVRETIITFDPCFDQSLWEDPDTGRQILQDFITGVDIIKPSKDDLIRLWGDIELLEGVCRYQKLGARHVVLTMGSSGVLYYAGEELEHLAPNLVSANDTTGAGDSLWAGMLAWILYRERQDNQISHGGMDVLPGELLIEAIKKGMETAAFTVQYSGAIAPLERISDKFL